MDQIVATSLCGLPLDKASLAIGVLHTVIYGGLFFYEMSSAFVDWIIVFNPPNLWMILYTGYVADIISSEAFLSFMASVCLVVGAWKSHPGLLCTWMVQQVVLILASLLTLFYFLVAQYLKVPILSCVFEVSINSFQAYFFTVVYAFFIQVRKGNLQDGSNNLSGPSSVGMS